MNAFAQLLETLVLTPSRNRKIAVISRYLAETPDPDRGYAIAAIAGDLELKALKPAVLRSMIGERVDPVLFALSYDYVGDLAETVSLLWPTKQEGELPGISELIERIEGAPKRDAAEIIACFFDRATPNERWAMIKVFSGGMRIGVSARLAKTALATFGGVELDDIERIWHGLSPPYPDLFAWLEGKAERPEIDAARTFHPMMLSNPIDENRDFEALDPNEYGAEWKWDGIRVQLSSFDGVNRLYSRTGEDISAAFPDIIDLMRGEGVLDGELLVGADFDPMPFNQLQQRLNRKHATASHLRDLPAFVRVYDMLFDGREDIRAQPLSQRRQHLKAWFARHPQSRLDISEQIAFENWDELGQIRERGANEHGHEGVMVKRLDSAYVAGRPRGPWFKWKRDPFFVDAILMYAQRGHGKRSSFYSDFTFGVWRGSEVVPIGKAYFGFTDEELRALDKWVRTNTVARFGPVRDLKKELVLEVAFDSAHESKRHKSGLALRFPRISRIRWDKPASEVESLVDVKRNLLPHIAD